MAKYFTLLIVLMFLIINGCSKNESSLEKNTDTAAAEKTALEKADPIGSYGKSITLTDQTSISEILANPEKYEGKPVLVSGTVIDVCSKRGCWIELAGDEEFQKIKVKVKDGEIVFPLSAKGNQALVEGIVEKLELTKEQTIKWKAHQAEEQGEEFDSTTITSPMNIWRLKGIGAEIKG